MVRMDKLKDIEIKAIYQALISKDFPSKMSKSFVAKVMNEINSSEKITHSFGKVAFQYASVFIFAVLTLYVLNYQDNKVEYSKTDIKVTSPIQTENVSNQLDSCLDKEDLSTKEEIACK